jgi:hypothetical protein
MALDILNLPIAEFDRLAPVAPRRAPLFCFALLTASCVLASFALACATPFAAFAVLAAALLPLPTALLVMAAVWIVNQAIGFGVLGYPLDAKTLFWGVAIGAAALISTAVAKLVLRSLALALVGAYASYELVLFAFTPALGGAGSFTLAVVARLGFLDLLWLVGLVAACEVFRLLNAIRRRQMAS